MDDSSTGPTNIGYIIFVLDVIYILQIIYYKKRNKIITIVNYALINDELV